MEITPSGDQSIPTITVRPQSDIPTITVNPDTSLPTLGGSQIPSQAFSSPQTIAQPKLAEAVTTGPVDRHDEAPTGGNTTTGPVDRHDDAPNAVPVAGTQVLDQPSSVSSPVPQAPVKDSRVRLSALDPSIFQGILAPLSRTGGLLFPYTPQIAYSQSVTYMDLALVHSNTDYQAYTRTPSVTISISGKFTVQSLNEGRYALACLHFLRTASKSHFGENDPQAGLPPPVLVLSGYGNYMFNKLRVVLKSHSWTFDENMDTVMIPVQSSQTTPPISQSVSDVLSRLRSASGGTGGGSGLVRLPALFTISCELIVVQTPRRMRQDFTFKGFASGDLMEKKEGWI